VGPKLSSFRQWAVTNCTVLPTGNAGQYATLNCKHSATRWGIAGSIGLKTVGPKLSSFRQWAVANCTVLPTGNAGQYATLNCKPPLFWFPVSGGM